MPAPKRFAVALYRLATRISYTRVIGSFLVSTMKPCVKLWSVSYDMTWHRAHRIIVSRFICTRSENADSTRNFTIILKIGAFYEMWLMESIPLYHLALTLAISSSFFSDIVFAFRLKFVMFYSLVLCPLLLSLDWAS